MSDTVVVPNNDPAAIESGNSWNGLDTAGAPVIVTFSFLTSLPAYDTTIGGFTPDTLTSFTPFNASEQAQALAALGDWAAASGIVFIEVPSGEGDITFGNLDFSTTSTGSSNGDYQNAGGIGFYPFGDWSYSTGNSSSGYGFTSDLGPAGAVFMNSNYLDSNGEVNFGTLLHEIGHAIGMKHPDQQVYTADGVDHNQVLDPAEDSSTLTIMSETGDAANDGGNSLFALDSLAAADLYGPAGTGGVETGSASGVNSVSSWSWDSTTVTLTQTAVSADETIHGTSVNDIIYGYDYGGAVATSGTINLFGLDGTNTLYAGSGTTNLYGGPDDNTLVGGAGNDSFYVYSDHTTVVDAYTGNNALYATGVSATLPANVDTLHLFGSGLTGTGNDQNDSIFGDGVYSNTLIAGSGKDNIVGGSGGNKLVAGTGIDTMNGGTGANTFVFAPGTAPVNNPDGTDYIGDFKPGTDKLDFSAFKGAGYDLTFVGTAPLTATGQVDYSISGGFTFVEGDVTSAGDADFEIQMAGSLNLQASDFSFGPACYASGTFILTVDGEVPIEDLAIGDQVITLAGEARPIRWIGRRAYDGRFIAGNRQALPICISAGALGDGVPARDLWLSPAHSLYVDGVLVPSEHLVNGATVVQAESVEAVEYFHIELDRHDVIFADGAPAESYVDCENRLMFANGGEYERLYPDDDRPRWAFCLPRLEWGDEALTQIRAAMLARAAALGHALDNDPGLHLVVDGQAVQPEMARACRYRFVVPANAAAVWLASRRTVPAEVAAASSDIRRLGVPVERLVLCDDDMLLEISHGHAGLHDGFYQDEDTHRWTNGMALLPQALLRPFGGGAMTLEVHLIPNALGYRVRSAVEIDAAA
jgi:Ca2+-binding RTX toxin-like protein